MLNKKQSHIQSNLYEYDFNSCFYNILKLLNYDISKINKDDKKIRNIQIGILQRDNPIIATLLHNKIENLIEIYKTQNNIKEEDIVWIQKDGFILKKKLNNLNITMPIDYRGFILKMISSMKKDKVLILNDGGIIDVKGISKKPLDLSFYNMFFNLDFNNKKKLINGIDYIRNKIYYSNNIKWFAREKENKIIIPLKNGLISLNKSSLSSININDIDKSFLWNDYIWPFAQTLLIYSNKYV